MTTSAPIARSRPLTHLIILSSVRWNFSWQRHHSLARAGAQPGVKVVFVEPHPRGVSHLIHGIKQYGVRSAAEVSHAVPHGVQVLRWRPTDIIYSLARRRLRAAVGATPQHVQVLLYLPSKRSLRLARAVSSRTIVYDRVLDWARVPDVWFPPQAWRRVESELKHTAVITTDAKIVAENLGREGAAVALIPPAVDEEFTSYPWTTAGPEAPIGYFGTIREDVIDLDLLIAASRFRPVEIVGDVDAQSKGRLAKHGIRVLPATDLNELPEIINSWRAILLPYRMDTGRDSLVPAKLWNAAASGRPILAQGIDIPEEVSHRVFPISPEVLLAPPPISREAGLRTWQHTWQKIVHVTEQEPPIRREGQGSTVDVAGFNVYTRGQTSLVRDIVAISQRQVVAFALHVGGLNQRKSEAYRAVMNEADFVYADGASIAGLVRLAGAAGVERAATTDIGWQVLREFHAQRGRRPRVALIGGEPGVAERAGHKLETTGSAVFAFAWHGFEDDYDDVLTQLNAAEADILFVGMGMPREAFWVQRERSRIDAGIILTCGGWFGFINGEEKRAPAVLQKLGLEWTWRLMQDPRRLWRRYLKGAFTTARTSAQIALRRCRG